MYQISFLYPTRTLGPRGRLPRELLLSVDGSVNQPYSTCMFSVSIYKGRGGGRLNSVDPTKGRIRIYYVTKQLNFCFCESAIMIARTILTGRLQHCHHSLMETESYNNNSTANKLGIYHYRRASDFPFSPDFEAEFGGCDRTSC